MESLRDRGWLEQDIYVEKITQECGFLTEEQTSWSDI